MHGSRKRYVTPIAFILLVALAASSRPPAPASPQAGPQLDPSKLPDAAGVHLGMSLDQAKAAFQKAYTTGVDALEMQYGQQNRPLKSVNVLRTLDASHNTVMQVDLTPPPTPQVAWRVYRAAPQPNVNRSVLLAALRQKYGKESIAIAKGKPTTDDSLIQDLWWVMDEQGHLMSGAPPIDHQSGNTPYGCSDGTDDPNHFPTVAGPAICSTLVILHAQFAATEIIVNLGIQMWDYAALTRAVPAATAFINSENQRLNRQQQQKAKETKPVL
jgi:hypothetical protein